MPLAELYRSAVACAHACSAPLQYMPGLVDPVGLRTRRQLNAPVYRSRSTSPLLSHSRFAECVVVSPHFSARCWWES